MNRRMVVQFAALPDAEAFREAAKENDPGGYAHACVTLSAMSGRPQVNVGRTADNEELAALFGGRVLRRVDVFGR